jgi:hypothetical protein
MKVGAAVANDNGLSGEVRVQTALEFFALGTFEQVKCWLEAYLEHADFGSPEPEIRGAPWRFREADGRLRFVPASPAATSRRTSP